MLPSPAYTIALITRRDLVSERQPQPCHRHSASQGSSDVPMRLRQSTNQWQVSSCPPAIRMITRNVQLLIHFRTR